ncbi:MAG TPA: alpha/beta fold hydrolase [Longimicrobiales bacterium]|nr:alpha/beta fold hydrolase [Longimicrobiales bacterium]
MTAGREVLPHEIYVPGDTNDAVPVLILLHGRGSHRGDLFGLQRHLPPEWAVVAPDAPFPAAPWGYGAGYAWYRYMGRNVPEEASFSGSLDALDRLLETLPDILGTPPSSVALGGFSQGGTVSTAYALSRPGRVRHVLNFSGFLADHPAVSATPDAVAGTRFFWGHGTQDGNIPFALGEEGRAALRAAGADLDARDYDIGHWIDPTELADAVAWLQRGGFQVSNASGS